MTRDKQSARSRFVRELILFVLVAAGISAYLHFRSPVVYDSDAFYHMGHASLYRERGPIAQEFPWAAYSVLSRHAGDLWYGFHLLLAPFSFIGDPMLGLKLAGVFLTSASLVILFLVFRRHAIAFAYLWPFLVLFVSPISLNRWLVVRPYVLSMPLYALLLSLMCRGRPWQVGLCALGITFLHQTLSWLVLVFVALVLAVRAVTERVVAWREALAAIAGLLVGWLVRPGAFEAARLMQIQIVEWGRVKQAGLPLVFGSEVYPIAGDVLKTNFAPLLVLWIAAGALMGFEMWSRRASSRPSDHSLLRSAGLLSLGFFSMAIASTQRGLDPWVVFATFFIAFSFSRFLAGRGQALLASLAETTRRAWAAITVGMLLAMAGWSERVSYKPSARETTGSYILRPAMRWLEARSKRGEIVFHVSWETFAFMFFWNRHNRYIGGMDPIFQYAYDPRLYWAVHRLHTRASAATTSLSPPGEPPRREDTYTVLRRDFKASYILVAPIFTPELFAHARSDPRFKPGYRSEYVWVFSLEQ